MVKQSQEVQHTYLPPTSSNLLEDFQANHRSYQLFREKGLDKNDAGFDERPGMSGQHWTTVNKILDYGIFRRMLKFLDQVDLSKGPIQRRITRLERRQDIDHVTNKMTEFLVTHVEWIAKDYFGNELVSVEFLEGMYNEPKTTSSLVNGRVVTNYANWVARYDIPFSVEAVNQTLENQISHPQQINYFVRVGKTQRDNTFSLEQFRDTTFAECQEISRQGKGLNR